MSAKHSNFERGINVMTREEKIVNLTTIRAKAEEAAKAYNEAYQSGKFDDAKKREEEVKNLVNEYTGNVREMCFEDCKNSDDAMLTAVKTLSYVTIRAKMNPVEGVAVPVMQIEDTEKVIDLLKLKKFCGGKLGANENWDHMIQKMNFTLTAQKCKDLGIDPKKVHDSYSMSEIAKQYDLGKNPASNTNLLKTLQVIVTAMLGEGYKATSHDVNYLTSIYSKKSRKALTVACANHRYLTAYICEICHRIVTGASYDVQYKVKKEG